MSNKIQKMRIPIELKQLHATQKNHGIICTPDEEKSSDETIQLIATIPGPKSSPYEDGHFKVHISFGAQYPFRPPTFKFITPVYHPNIDQAGKICLDLLRMPPTGSYNPAITLESILLSIQLLLATPNPDDPLHGEAADLYKTNLKQFEAKAREFVKKNSANGDTDDAANGEPEKISRTSTETDGGAIKKLKLTC